jgi:hypothetical protein
MVVRGWSVAQLLTRNRGSLCPFPSISFYFLLPFSPFFGHSHEDLVVGSDAGVYHRVNDMGL